MTDLTAFYIIIVINALTLGVLAIPSIIERRHKKRNHP